MLENKLEIFRQEAPEEQFLGLENISVWMKPAQSGSSYYLEKLRQKHSCNNCPPTKSVIGEKSPLIDFKKIIHHICSRCGKETKNRKDNYQLKVFVCEFCNYRQLC